MMDIENYKVKISSKAYKQISRHVNFMKNISCSAANELRKTFIKDISSLHQMPQRHNFWNNDVIPTNKYRKMLSSKRYLIIYQISENTVLIETVIDTRQNFEWLIF